MGDLAIFTEAIAEELIARGFELVAKTEKAWYFRDSELLCRIVTELVEAMQELDK